MKILESIKILEIGEDWWEEVNIKPPTKEALEMAKGLVHELEASESCEGVLLHTKWGGVSIYVEIGKSGEIRGFSINNKIDRKELS